MYQMYILDEFWLNFNIYELYQIKKSRVHLTPNTITIILSSHLCLQIDNIPFSLDQTKNHTRMRSYFFHSYKIKKNQMIINLIQFVNIFSMTRTHYLIVSISTVRMCLVLATQNGIILVYRVGNWLYV